MWKPEEVIRFASDCVSNGIKAVSLGGGEPFEYEGIFDIIDALYTQCYLSVTTNGLPLEDEQIWKQLLQHHLDKIHVTIHQPQDAAEVDRVEKLVLRLKETEIKPGVNLLVGADKVEESRTAYARMRKILEADQIIVIPQRFGNTPTPKQLAYVADNKPFQSPSCLLGCKRPENFVSVSWDKRVNSCSYAGGKVSMDCLDYNGLMKALDNVEWKTCLKVL